MNGGTSAPNNRIGNAIRNRPNQNRQNRQGPANPNRGPGRGPGAGGVGAGNRYVGAPMTEREAMHVAHSEANVAYNPLREKIRGEERGSHQREHELGSFYGQLSNQIGQAGLTAENAQKAASAALQSQLTSAAQASQANQAQIAGGNAEFAKLVGANPAAFAPGTQQAAAAAQQRQLMGVNLSAPVIEGAANQVGYLAGQGVNARHEGIFQRLQEARRGRTIRQDLEKLKREKGAATVEDLNKLREAERNFKVQQEAFGQKQHEFNVGQQSAAAEARQKAAEFAAQQGQQGVENQQKNRELNQEGYKIHHPGSSSSSSSGGGMTPEDRSNALAAARAFIGAHGWPKNPAARAELVEKVGDKGEVSPAAAAWAVHRLLQHHHSTSLAGVHGQTNAAG